MRPAYLGLILAAALAAIATGQQAERDFSGTWRLNRDRSAIRALPEAPGPVLTVAQHAALMRITAAGAARTVSTDGSETNATVGDAKATTVLKWEGAALLFNTLVSGPARNYGLMERWSVSRDRAQLTIAVEFIRGAEESDSILVYDRDGTPAAPPLAPAPPAAVQVPKGTRIPLGLLNSISTKGSREGDRIYLTTLMPVALGGRIVIPAGSYVSGTVTSSIRPGRVKGRGELYLRFDSLTLPNGTTRDLRSRLGQSDAAGEVDRAEGKVRGEGGKGHDAGTVAQTTAAGASVGGLAGAVSQHPGMGVGIGAAAGAAAGLAGVLLSRGPDVTLPRGTTVEMVLDRDLHFEERELMPR